MTISYHIQWNGYMRMPISSYDGMDIPKRMHISFPQDKLNTLLFHSHFLFISVNQTWHMIQNENPTFALSMPSTQLHIGAIVVYFVFACVFHKFQGSVYFNCFMFLSLFNIKNVFYYFYFLKIKFLFLEN